MSLPHTKLHPLFGAKLLDTDLREIKPNKIGKLLDFMGEYAVCAVPHRAPMTNEQHINFSKMLGPIERSAKKIAGTGKRLPFDEIIDQSNLGPEGAIYKDGDRRLALKRANRLWHTDMSFYRIRGTYSVLSAHIVPPKGGNTELIDMRTVYRDLPDTIKKRLVNLSAEHCYWHSRTLGGGPSPSAEEKASRPPATHPLVLENRRTRREALYLASHIKSIKGLEENEGKQLLDELNEFATQKKYILSYHWSVGDVLIWDNLATMHRATPFLDQKYVRDMRRTTCRDLAI